MATIAFLEPYLPFADSPRPASAGLDLVQMLLMSALDKLDRAFQAHEAGRWVEKGFYLGRAAGVVEALREALDLESGGQTAQALERAHRHLAQALRLAALEDVPEALDQARDGIRQLSAGWQAALYRTSPLKGTA